MESMIQVRDQAVTAALTRLLQRVEGTEPVLRAIGEDMTERTKRRFAEAKAPDGTPWTPNSTVTLARYIQSKGGFKSGILNAKGKKLSVSKRPLQGISGDLARQFHYDVDDDELTFGSTMVYAAMQHFGGTKAQFPHLWGTIPARPHMPIDAASNLYPQEAERIVDMIREFLEDVTG
jgi:phage virion morphogenesis protein